MNMPGLDGGKYISVPMAFATSIAGENENIYIHTPRFASPFPVIPTAISTPARQSEAK